MSKTKKSDHFFWATIICWIIAGLAVAVWIYLDHQRWLHEPRVIQPLFPQHTIQDFRDAHKYHGIWCSYQDHSGTWYFIRDGQHCRLFAYKERG